MTFIYAHRGFSASYPENTMIAFQQAAKHGADGIELDVQFTKDREIVVIHDTKVDRTTNGTGFVKDYTLKEMKQLHANYHFKHITKSTIPTLAEVFTWLSTNDLHCNIELKNIFFPYHGLEEEVIQLIHKYDLSDRIIISSFNHYSLVHCYQIAPHIETAPLIRDGIYMPWVYAKAIHAKGLHLSYLVAQDKIVQQSFVHGIKVRPFTVNAKSEMERLFSLRCTAIITDEVEKAINLRSSI